MTRVHKRILLTGVTICILLFMARYPIIHHRIEMVQSSNLFGIVTQEEISMIKRDVNQIYWLYIMVVGAITLIAMALTMKSLEKEKKESIEAMPKNEIKRKLATLKSLHDDEILSETEYQEKRKDIINKLEL